MRKTFISLTFTSTLLCGTALGQGILPELMYGVYGLDDSCAIDSRRMLITPTDILIADPGLDIRIAYPDQRHVSGDEVPLSGNFFVSVVYDGSLRRTADGAVMSFNFPDLSFPLLEPIMKSVLGDEVPSAIQADLVLMDQGDLVSMRLQSDDPSLGSRLTRVIGTWNFDADQITRVRGESKSTYLRCFDGKTASQQHGSLIGGTTGSTTGIYARDGQCSADGEAFVIAQDGWGLSIPFADPTIGFAFAAEGADLIGELYRAPFAPLAPNENSYIDIEVRDGTPNHRLQFSGNGFTWLKTLGSGDVQDAGTYSKCAEVGDAPFSEVVTNLGSYL